MRTARSERSELVRAEVASIRRYATVAGLKRRALSLTAPMTIIDDEKGICVTDTLGLTKGVVIADTLPRRPRPLFVFPENARLRRLLTSCVCLHRPG
jgi:hypothetical protein